jgi:hypothetical protein
LAHTGDAAVRALREIVAVLLDDQPATVAAKGGQVGIGRVYQWIDEREAAASQQPTIGSFVVLMLVKESSNLLLQLELTSRATIEAASSKSFRWISVGKIIPLHDHGCAEKPQHTPFRRRRRLQLKSTYSRA